MTAVPPGYSERISIGGERRLSTLSGDIRLEQNRGRLAIYDPITGELRNVQDVDGTHIYDEQGREMTRLDTLGLTTIEPDTGIERNRLGIARSDSRTGNWVTKPGVDLRSKGI